MQHVTLKHWARGLDGIPVYEHHAVQVCALDGIPAVFHGYDPQGNPIRIDLPILDYRSDTPLSWVDWDRFSLGKNCRVIQEKGIPLHIFESRIAAVLRYPNPYNPGVHDCETVSRFIMNGKAESHQSVATLVVAGIAGLLWVSR